MVIEACFHSGARSARAAVIFLDVGVQFDHEDRLELFGPNYGAIHVERHIIDGDTFVGHFGVWDLRINFSKL